MIHQSAASTDQMKQIYEIVNLVSSDEDSKVYKILKEVTHFLNLQIGIVSRIAGDDYTVLDFYTSEDIGLKKSQVFAFKNTYCEITFAEEYLVDITSMKESRYHKHPCYDTFHLEAYIAVPYYLHGKKHGTISFSSPQKREEDFSETEKNLVMYLGQWMSNIMQKQYYEDELLETNRQLRKIIESNKQISYTLSHDFKAPLNNLQALFSFLEVPPTADNKRTQELIDDTILGMKDMIMQVGSLYQMEDEDLGARMVKVNPVYLLESTIPPYEEAAQKKGISIKRDFKPQLEEVEVETDPAYLKTIFVNLITNAIKFSPQGGYILLRHKAEEGCYVLEFADEGEGFERQDLPFAFKKFSRLSAQPTANENTSGLGLYIVKEAADKIGAEVQLVPNDEVKGGVVRLLLPIKS